MGGSEPSSDEVLLSASVGSGAASAALGCLGALALIPLVMFGVNLFMKDVPDAVAGLTPWFGGAALVFAAITVAVYLRSRKKAELVRTAAGLSLRVDGEEIARGPFEVTYGYQKVQIKVGVPRTAVLILGVAAAGKPVASFTEEWGAIHGTPDGWPDKWPQLPPGAPHHFKVLMGKFCAELVRHAESK
jgi:hypothetical protein